MFMQFKDTELYYKPQQMAVPRIKGFALAGCEKNTPTTSHVIGAAC